MLTNKALYDTGVYTNLQGLGALHHEYKTNASGVKKEVAQQFESLLVQMLLKSMRDTNKEFSSGLMDSQQSAFYDDLYDKQLSLVISKSGLGIATTIENYLDKTMPAEPTLSAGITNKIPVVEQQPLPTRVDSSKVMPEKIAIAAKEPESTFDSAADFVKQLWGSAKVAAKILGADPKILLAQAALETNWGKKIIPQTDGKSTKNLFNIKADNKWSRDTANFNTIEEQDGVLVKEKAKFRAYDSFQESFIDYTNFLQHNSRYGEALQNARDARKFVTSLQNANYATDSSYSEKIMDIYSSKKFNNLFEQYNLI